MRNPVRHSERTPRAGAIARAAGQEDASKTSKKAFTAGAWEEARGIIWTHRKRLALGLGLMLINRLSGLGFGLKPQEIGKRGLRAFNLRGKNSFLSHIHI